MSNSEYIIEKIDTFYIKDIPHKSKTPEFFDFYEKLKANHAGVINSLLPHLIDVNEYLPTIGDRVFAIHDLRSIGKGAFVNDYYYNEYGFVSEMCYDDSYGFITHWVSFETINALECNPIDIEQDK